MSFGAALTACFALLACATALFNLWLYWLRPRETSHLWIGVVSIGVLWIAAGNAAGDQATSLAEAQHAQLLSLGGALPLVVGFLRFTSAFLGTRLRRLEQVCGTFTAIAVTAAYAAPSLFFDGRAIEGMDVFGHRTLQAGLTPFAILALTGFAAMFLAVAALYARHRHELAGGRGMTLALALWTGLALHDVAMAVGAIGGPWLMGLGFGAFTVAFGSILLGRFVRALAHVEQSAEELHRLVETRTAELRRKDLELVHGARLATLGALAAGLAHEIHDPVGSLSGHVKELRECWRDPERRAGFAPMLREARVGVERVRTVISELLRLARREEGREGLHDLPRIVASVLPIVHYELRNRARLETHLAATPAIRGDEAMLSQIVLNLLVGALAGIPEGMPERHRIVVSTAEAAGRARLVVSDNAPGLPPELLPHLFDPFVSSAIEDPRRIGFAVTHQLVKRHRGTIDVDSSERGTRIAVELPAAHEGTA
jgi:signal transduction histidine kinase